MFIYKVISTFYWHTYMAIDKNCNTFTKQILSEIMRERLKIQLLIFIKQIIYCVGRKLIIYNISNRQLNDTLMILTLSRFHLSKLHNVQHMSNGSHMYHQCLQKGKKSFTYVSINTNCQKIANAYQGNNIVCTVLWPRARAFLYLLVILRK